MPIYEFNCLRCEKDFESLMKPYDPVRCPHCLSAEAQKKLSAFGSYSIAGDNSASVTPKKFRKSEEEK